MIEERHLRLRALSCEDLTLRELVQTDAACLYEALRTDRPPDFIPAPPDTVIGFERFIAINRRKSEEGRGGCLGVVPGGATGPIGLFQLSLVHTEPPVVEWGFILSRHFWGTGVFMKSATLVLDFVFGEYGAERVQGRCAVENHRATGALRKLGAVPGAIVHEPRFFDRPRNGQTWQILAASWLLPRHGKA
jgi:RimJ/RimL family protein N-acetyltransferase